MLRPIPPQMAWQAIAACAGFFTLVAALAAPVDLWRLSVLSRQGEPLRAVATLVSRPDEHISNGCLSMGPESDAPDPALPFLKQADLQFDPARGTVAISTRAPVSVPVLALVLRVQCPGAPLYARHFTALIPPAAGPVKTATAPSTPAPPTTAAPTTAAPTTAPPTKTSPTVQPQAARAAPAQPQASAMAPTPATLAAQPAHAGAVKRAGFHLSLLPGDSVASIAAVLFPGKPEVQRKLTQQVIGGNPRVFPAGRARDVPAGTVLWFPDLHELRKSASEKPAPQPGAAISSAGGDAAPPATQPRSRITLRRALALGDRPGPQECRELMQLCGAEPAAAAPSPELEQKARSLETGVQQLRLKQDSIDQQLARIEQSIQTLQKSIAAAPASHPVPVPPPAPPRVEIRTVVKSEPIAWYVWLGFAGLLVLGAAAGVAYGRRGTISRESLESDEQLDRMLATAATAMRELEAAAPKPAPRPPPRLTAQAAAPPPAREPEPPPQTFETPSASTPPDLLLEPDAGPSTTAVDVNLEAAPPETAQADGLSSEVLYEMDQALDNTRSMFTDVDRFIALGRTQNALSLLQFQVHKDPKDRDSWIKLLAIYRQEKMDEEYARAVREFKRNFPNENTP